MKKYDNSNHGQVIFLNPHVTHAGKIFSHFFNGKKNYSRYKHLAFSNFMKYQVTFLFNGENSSFRRPWLRKLLSRRYLIWLEIFPWLVINRINLFTHPLKFSIKCISPDYKILVFSTDLINYSESMIIELEKFNGYIYIHMTHYYLNPSKLSSVISRLKKPVLLSEGSLIENEFFQFHFKSSIDHIQIPLVSDKRFFSASVANDNRKLKCLVVGSVPRIYNADFCNYFGEMNYLHPMRKILYENQESLKNELMCHGRFVGAVEPELSQNQTSAGENFFVYDQFDIVEEFRNYWMFVSPEEIIGLPSVNFIDGMMSGSAFLGASNEIYTGYGMIPGIHYISYSVEDLKDLVRIIKYYQNNPSELETIASAGQKFVQDNFSEQQVVSKLNKIFEI